MEKVVVKRREELDGWAFVSINTEWVADDNQEKIGYILAEGIWAYLKDLREVVKKEQLPLYNKYVDWLRTYISMTIDEVN